MKKFALVLLVLFLVSLASTVEASPRFFRQPVRRQVVVERQVIVEPQRFFFGSPVQVFRDRFGRLIIIR